MIFQINLMLMMKNKKNNWLKIMNNPNLFNKNNLLKPRKSQHNINEIYLYLIKNKINNQLIKYKKSKEISMYA